MVKNNEGITAIKGDAFTQLERTMSACMLWEDGFYESGQTVAQRVQELVPKCSPLQVHGLAIRLRNQMKLRHAPLMLLRELARSAAGREHLGAVMEQVIQRPDELTEFLSLYWKEDDKQAIAKQVKIGLAAAFGKFNEYQLAKWNRSSDAIKLRDVIRLVHPKPATDAQSRLWRRLVKDELKTPDTWEVALSAGGNKGATFERLLDEGKLGYLALLRNLRNMEQAKVPKEKVWLALHKGAPTSRVLPFRFIAAARACPAWTDAIDDAMQLAMAGMPRIPGTTVILVDTSPSMAKRISAKSDLSRKDAAAALAILLRGVCEGAVVLAFSSSVGEVAAGRKGLKLAEAIGSAVESNGTKLGAAVRAAAARAPHADRLIVFTDEESQDPVGAPHCKGYMINVATTRYGIGSGEWERVSGFSESIVQYIATQEALPGWITEEQE